MTNPLLGPWTTPFGIAPFPEIRPEHFPPAYEAAYAAHNAEIEAIVTDPDEPTFANTAEASERAGALLARIASVFWNQVKAHSNAEIAVIEREIIPRSIAHRTAIMMDERLCARFEALWQRREALKLDAEATRLVERWRRGFVRSGVDLPAEKKLRLAAIMKRFAALATRFSQNVRADEAGWLLVLDRPEDLDGLPAFLREVMAQAATDRGHHGKHALTLSRSIIEPFLTFSTRRDLRERAFKAWARRGDNGGDTDNRAIMAEILALRVERAQLLDFASFAAFKLDDTMAKTPERARALLEAIWRPALAKVEAERDELGALAAEGGWNIQIEPWDWLYWQEQVRKRRFDLDEAELKPYLPLAGVLAAAFDTAARLFGLSFNERPDVLVYHPDVRAFEVSRDGCHVGLFLADHFARPSKRSGAWMTNLRMQDGLTGDPPIVVNVLNVAKPPQGAPVLLSFEEARMLFHEFGHGLHGLLSETRYPSLAGTAVDRDFVELPSQLFERWLDRPEILSRFARHETTGQPIPPAIIDKLLAARRHGQALETLQLAACALLDLDVHALETAENIDPLALEREILQRIGMPANIGMRHRASNFAHIFAQDGYSAGYYSYLWSEMLSADAFQAFVEAGDLFDRQTAKRLYDFVYSAGNKRASHEAYTAFRGRLPTVDALLTTRGLL